MKKLLSLVAAGAVALAALSFAACGTDKKGENKILDYSDIYRHTAVKSDEISGKSVYKASYGYNGVREQGYNCFYYCAGKDGELNDMRLDGGVWKGSAAEINGGVMKSAPTEKAVRVFVSPVSGEAEISGNPYLVSGAQAAVSVYCGTDKIGEWTVDDATGIWHEDTVYLTEGQRVYFVVSGGAEVCWNPSVDFTGRAEGSLHHAADGYYGDVHPFYDEAGGKLYMYYLSTGNQKGDRTETFGSLLTTSTDFVNYADEKLALDKTNPPEQELYFALGVYKDKDGIYRSSYGKGNYAGASKSADLINWSNGAEMYIDPSDGMLKYKYRAYFDEGVYSGRDPDVYYDADSDRIYCIVMNYYSDRTDKGEKGLALYTATSDGVFSTKAVKLLDFTGRGDPECPQLKKIGDRWYMFYSVYGTGTAGGVGRLSYRVGGAGVSPENVDWQNTPERSLDGGDLHAAQICEVGGRYYMYGWIGSAPDANVWGGYLNIAREVYVKQDGTLGTRCDEYLTNLLNKGRVAELNADNTALAGMSADGGKFTALSDNAAAVAEGTFGRSLIFARLDISSSDNASVALTSGGKTYYAGVTVRDGKKYLFVNDSLNASPREVEIESGKTSFDLKIIADGAFIEAFADDEYSVTAHTTLSAGYKVSLAAGAGASFSDVEICRLADGSDIFD